MSASLSKLLSRCFDDVVMGPPVLDRHGDLPNVVIYPLFPSRLDEKPPELITLSEGMRRGLRLSDTGLVNKIHVENPLPATVLAGESELLMGNTQLRSMQFSCLLPPFRRASLPVNCVEEGQPAEAQVEFDGSDSVPWGLRSFKIEQMSHHGEPVQFVVWDRVKDYLAMASTHSDTHDIHAVYDRYGDDLSSYSRLFPRQSGQVGAVCAVGSNIYCELFADPELLEDRYDHLLKSSLIEAVVHPGVKIVPQDKVDGFLDQVAEVSVNSRIVQSRSLQSSGRTAVFSGRGIAGSALVDGARVIHLVAHQKCLGESSPFAEQLSELKRDSDDWRTQRGGFLDQLERDYRDRSRDYRSFKAQLAPVTTPQIHTGEVEPYDFDTGDTASTAPRSQPLNAFLHDFFLRLFRRV